MIGVSCGDRQQGVIPIENDIIFCLSVVCMLVLSPTREHSCRNDLNKSGIRSCRNVKRALELSDGSEKRYLQIS